MAHGRNGVKSRKRDRQETQRHRDKVLLILLVLLMLSAAALGLYLASRGLHPKQLRRRKISHVGGEFQSTVQDVRGLFQRNSEH